MTPFVARAFENIAMAKVSTSGPDAVRLGLFRATDRMTVNRDLLIEDAKKMVLAMNLEGYAPGRPLQKVRVPGEPAFALMKLALYSLHEAGYILDHDLTVSTKVAEVLTGGNVLEGTLVSEQYLLDLEREAFLSLAGEPLTQARMQHMLETGKPLRN
jgi:3-hydroxyacyl-CoA dehydrogenase